MVMRLIAIVAAGSCLIGIARAQPDKVLYELQERCGKQAAEVFQKEWGAHVLNNKDGYTLADYENHYSPRLNKCFYLEKSNNVSKLKSGATMNTQGLTLYDLNENKQYGSFVTGTPGQVQGRDCRSEQEWRELARPFLEE